MNPLLQATLLHPHDRDAHAVYADWLIQQGSPLGHAINAELAGVHGLALARLYTPCIEAILGPLLPYVRPLEIRWGRCVRGLLHQETEDRRHPFWSVLELPKGPSGRPIPPPDNRFMPVWPLSEGIDRRIWLAWDVERQRSVTLAMLDEEFSPIRLVPTEHSTGIEVYPAGVGALWGRHRVLWGLCCA